MKQETAFKRPIDYEWERTKRVDAWPELHEFYAHSSKDFLISELKQRDMVLMDFWRAFRSPQFRNKIEALYEGVLLFERDD
jgi:hypothetical protein